MKYIQEYLDEIGQILHNMPQAKIARTIDILTQARTEEKRIFVMGNGGSAAMASSAWPYASGRPIVSGSCWASSLATCCLRRQPSCGRGYGRQTAD